MIKLYDSKHQDKKKLYRKWIKAQLVSDTS